MNRKDGLFASAVHRSVKNYLEAKVQDNYLDMDDMTRSLHAANFGTVPYNVFKASVESAYNKIAADSYAAMGNGSDESDSDGSDLEVLSNNPQNPMSDMMTQLYTPNKQSVVNISSDDDDDDDGISASRNNNATKTQPGSTTTTTSSSSSNNSLTIGSCVVTKLPGNAVTSSKETVTLKRPDQLMPSGQQNAKKYKVDSSSNANINANSPVVQNRTQAALQQQKPKVINYNQRQLSSLPPRYPPDNGSNRPKSGRSGGGGASSFDRAAFDYLPARPSGRSRRYKMEVICADSTLTFRDIGGMEKTLKELCEVLLHIKSPTVYHVLGLSPPRGILLHGPPGCGKNLLAHAIAGQLKLGIIEITATELIAGVSGESEERIRDVFEQACQNQPCVLFIDEIDAVSGNRNFAQKDMERRVVSQLISCMDGLHSKESGQSVLVIGATTRPDVLDPGLRRVGRFDHEIAIGIPTRKDRVQILEILCEGLSLESEFDFDKIAELTPGYVGADLLALVSRAATIAVKRRCTEQMHAFWTQPVKDIPIVNLDDDGEAVVDVDVEVDGEVDAEKDIEKNGKAEKAGKEVEKAEKEVEKDAKQFEAATSKEVVTDNSKEVETSAMEVDDTEDDAKNISDKAEDKATEKSDAKEAKEDEISEVSSTEINVTTNTSTESVKVMDSDTTISNKETSLSVKTNGDTLIQTVTDSVEEAEKVAPNTNAAKTSHIREPSLRELLYWLDNPPEEFSTISDLTFTIEDFVAAVKVVQPSAKREGFITVPDVTWDDVGSLRDVRDELKLAVLAPVKHPEILERLGLTAPSGVLLCGPPGCGKTLLAKAIANEAGINFISVKGPELMNMYVGESERAVRACFQRARNSAPCVIFFDEFDSLCPKRSEGNDSGSGTRIVNQLLTEMDGVDERKGVYVLAATNRPDIIDPAILRPGRLDTILYVGMPQESDRLEILNATTKNGTKPVLAADVSLEVLALKTDGYTGADLAGLVRQAAMLALKDALDSTVKAPELFVRMKHFEVALQMLRPSVNEQDRKVYDKLRLKYAAPRTPNTQEK